MIVPRLARKGFEATLDAARPELWELAIASVDGSYECTLAWPDSKGATLEELFTTAAIPFGTYRVEARRIHDDATPASTLKGARARLRKHGPMSTVYSHGVGLGDAMTTPPPANGAARAARAVAAPAFPPLGPDPEISELNRQRQRDLAEAAAINAQRNLERARRESESHNQPNASSSPEIAALRYELLRELDRIRADSRPPSMVPLLSAIAPLLQAIVTTMMQSAQRRDEMMLQLFGQQAGSSGGSGIDVMGGVLPLIRQVIELSQELNGGGGEDRGMLGDVASIVGVLGKMRDGGTPPPETPGAMSVVANSAGPVHQVEGPPRRLPTAEEAVQMRVLAWLAAVQEYMAGEADPFAVADHLEPQLGLLPKQFRELIGSGNALEAVLSGLAQWMPRQLHERLCAHVRASDAARSWLESFLEALLPDDDDQDAELEQTTAAEP